MNHLGKITFVTTTSGQFDPEAMRESIGRLLALSPPVMYLTHYGQLYPNLYSNHEFADLLIFAERKLFPQN